MSTTLSHRPRTAPRTIHSVAGAFAPCHVPVTASRLPTSRMGEAKTAIMFSSCTLGLFIMWWRCGESNPGLTHPCMHMPHHKHRCVLMRDGHGLKTLHQKGHAADCAASCVRDATGTEIRHKTDADMSHVCRHMRRRRETSGRKGKILPSTSHVAR